MIVKLKFLLKLEVEVSLGLGEKMNEKLNLSENALKVLEKRYLKRDNQGNCTETAADMFQRVASSIAAADLQYGKSQSEVDELTKKFYDAITNRYFMPNSPTLMNAGRELGQLSACFVLPVEDSLEGIFESVKNQALIHKSGGGTGFSFSRLRPKNDVVRSTMGVSSGPVSFMEVFNAATEAVKQGGTRRGANMGILRVDHPDIIEFINCKSDNTRLNNFNISVAITDKFMDALKVGGDYELYHPKTKAAVGTLNAKQVFDLIIDGAWRNGEPGIVFIDKMNADNPTPLIGEIESTNPCGEVPLLAYEACNLGSINLGLMLKETSNGLEVDWEKLKEITKLSIDFLDNVITVNNYPLPKIAEMVQNNRKIGLGVMGWADMLMQLNLSYNSKEGTDLAYQIMEFIDYHSKVESIELAKARGAFENFQGSVYDNQNFLEKKYTGKSAGLITDEDWKNLDAQIKEFGIRNSTTTCIAPTGTISMIASSSGGVEPLFGLVFSRNVMDGTEMLEINPVFKQYAIDNGFYSEKLMKQIAQDGSIAHVDGVSEEIKQIFATAHDVTPEWHVRMQAAFQLHTDNAVSKTINFEESATRDDIEKAYVLAFENDLKGITVYRNNSRTFQPMNLEVKKETSLEIKPIEEEPTGEIKNIVCPECKTEIHMAEGCFMCPGCGYSGCS